MALASDSRRQSSSSCPVQSEAAVVVVVVVDALETTAKGKGGQGKEVREGRYMYVPTVRGTY